MGETAHPCRPTRCNPRRPLAWWACRAVLSAPAFEPCGPLTNGKDASFPNSDNRRLATSTSESFESRRRVWFRHATARVGGRLTARTELRWSRGTRLGTFKTCPASATRSLAGCRSSEPSERRHLDLGVFFRDYEEPVPPLTPEGTSPSSRSLKSPPNPDRSRSRQRSAPGARPWAPSIDECRAPLSRREARHRSRGFAASTRLPTLVRRPCCEGRLDVMRHGLIVRASSTPNAARRLLQSITIHKHDRWIGGDPGLSCSRTSLERSRTECAPFPSRGRAQPGGFGSGAARGCPRNSTSPDEIALVRSFAPARLARTPHVAEPGRPSRVECS